DAQGILLFAMIDFDLPAVEIDLQQLLGGTAQVAGEQVSRVAIIQPFALTLAVGSRRDHDHPQRTLSGTALPINLGDLLIANVPPRSTIEDLGRLPAAVFVLAHLLGSELVDSIKPSGIGSCAKAQLGVLASSGQ